MKLLKDLITMAGAVIAGYTIYKIWQAVSTTAGAVTGAAAQWTPGGIVQSVLSSVGNDVSSLASNVQDTVTSAVQPAANAAYGVPQLAAKSSSLSGQIIAQNNSEYAPGGRIYNSVAASQGTAAADANWAKVQADDASMLQSDAANLSDNSTPSWLDSLSIL